MSNQTFRKDELVIEYTQDRGSHSIRIVKIANSDVRYDDETALVMMGAFATKVPKDSLYKLPAGIKRSVLEKPVINKGASK